MRTHVSCISMLYLCVVACSGSSSREAVPSLTPKRSATARIESSALVHAPQTSTRSPRHPVRPEYRNEHNDPFFRSMYFVDSDFRPLQGAEMIEASKAVVRGTIEAITDGRVYDFASGPSNPTYNALLKVAVDETFKTDREIGSHVYVEVVRAPFVKPSELHETRPNAAMTLFLTEAHHVSAYKYSNDSTPTGEVLYALRTPQGMLLDTEGGLFTQPLSESPIFGPEVDTVDEVKAELEVPPTRGAGRSL